MKALVTGATGFVGQHLCRWLQASGVEVITLGRRPSSYPHFSLTDVRDLRAIESAFQQVRPTFVYHLAGSAQPSDAETVNVAFARQIFCAMQSASLACRVLVVGTAAEYGTVDDSALPIAEGHLCRPLSLYGSTKLEQTDLALRAARAGTQVVVARPFNVIGAGMGSHLLPGKVAQHLAHVRAGAAMPELRVGQIASTRDFVDVADVVRCFHALLQHDDAIGQVVNVCTGQETSVRTLLEVMIRLSRVSVELIEVDDLGVSSTTRSVGDPTLLTKLAGYRPYFEPERSLRALLGAT